MKLLNIKSGNCLKAAIVDYEGVARDLSYIVPFISGKTLTSEVLERIKDVDIYKLASVNSRFDVGPCIADVGKIICIGLNYFDHAKEANLEMPKEPVIFLKATSAITGPYDDLVIPRGLTKCDWEAELAIVIGLEGRNIPLKYAKNHIAGFCVINDISERSFQFERSGQWTKGKSLDGFAPIGPWLVTQDEIDNPQNLNIWLEVNGKRYQSSNTSQMKEDVYSLISYVSEFMSLQPGDIIATGTPSGVGFGQNPPRYLKDGDFIRAGIDGLGEQAIKVREEIIVYL